MAGQSQGCELTVPGSPAGHWQRCTPQAEPHLRQVVPEATIRGAVIQSSTNSPESQRKELCFTFIFHIHIFYSYIEKEISFTTAAREREKIQKSAKATRTLKHPDPQPPLESSFYLFNLSPFPVRKKGYSAARQKELFAKAVVKNKAAGPTWSNLCSAQVSQRRQAQGSPSGKGRVSKLVPGELQVSPGSSSVIPQQRVLGTASPCFATGLPCSRLLLPRTVSHWQSSSQLPSIGWMGCCQSHESLNKANIFKMYSVQFCFFTLEFLWFLKVFWNETSFSQWLN